MRRSLWPRKSPLWSPPTTTRCRRSPYSTERCIAVSTQMCTNNEIVTYHRGAQGRFIFVFCVRLCVCWHVINSGVGRQAVRSCGEEGPAQRGVSLPPLHGLRSCGRVQEDAAGENAHAVASKQTATVVSSGWLLPCSWKWHLVVRQAGMALYKIVPKNPYYFWSVMSLVMQVGGAVARIPGPWCVAPGG